MQSMQLQDQKNILNNDVERFEMNFDIHPSNSPTYVPLVLAAEGMN